VKYLLDTNICIYIIKQKPIHVLERFKSFDVSDVGVSTVTVAELEFGIYKSKHREKNRAALNKFLLPLEILEFTERAAQHYGRVRAYLEEKGMIIGAMDMLIAAHAISQDVILATNNVEEFSRVPDLKIENWANV